MTVEGVRNARRWQLAIAIVAALGVFCAVTAGWASRGTANLSPQPAAGVNVARAQAHNATPAASGSSPTHHKTTKTAWMTRDRPPTWARSAPQSIGSPLPFVPAVFRLPRAPSAAPGALEPDRDLFTRLCVARC